MKPQLASALLLAAICASCSTSAPKLTQSDRVLRGEFVYEPNLSKSPLTKGRCTPSGGRAGAALAAVATDIAVALAGKVVEGAIDYAAAKTKPEATTLEEIIPIEAFYMDSSFFADDACLVIHNGQPGTGQGATLLGVFQLTASPDRTAFRFTVREWTFTNFVNNDLSHWGQKSDVRDFAIKFEFLLPGASGQDAKPVAWEKMVTASDLRTLQGLFSTNQRLPWMPMPPLPTQSNGATRPLNVKVTLVETSAPYQFATWLQESVSAKKSELSAVAQGAVRRTLDRNYAAEEDLKSATAASVAFDAYKAAWDAALALAAKKPVLKANPSTSEKAELASWIAQSLATQATVDAKRIAAEVAFSRAGLPWPGALPNPFV